MKEINISNPETVDEYKENLKTLLLLADSKKREGLTLALNSVRKAFINECMIIEELIECLQAIEEKIQGQYIWMTEYEEDEDVCSEFYVDKMMTISCIRQKIHDLIEIRDMIVKCEQSYNCPKPFPDEFGDNQ